MYVSGEVRTLTKKRFCSEYLGKNENYLYVLKYENKEPSSDSLLKCYFGLKNTDSVISLEVDWPDGFKHSFNDIKANNHYVISQSNSEGDRTSKNIATKPNTIFNEVSGISSAKHSETFFDDFELQPLLPNKLSHYGPGLAVGDTNRDGVNEFIVSSAKGETLSIH